MVTYNPFSKTGQIFRLIEGDFNNGNYFRSRAYAIAMRYGVRRDDIPDVFQSFYLRVLRKGNSVYTKIDESMSLSENLGVYHWLTKTFKNECRNFKKKKKHYQLDKEDELYLLTPERDDPHNQSERSEQGRRLNRFISSPNFPQMYREVITKRYFDGMLLREIANSLGRPTGTIKSELYNARRKLKDMIVQRVM